MNILYRTFSTENIFKTLAGEAGGEISTNVNVCLLCGIHMTSQAIWIKSVCICNSNIGSTRTVLIRVCETTSKRIYLLRQMKRILQDWTSGDFNQVLADLVAEDIVANCIVFYNPLQQVGIKVLLILENVSAKLLSCVFNLVEDDREPRCTLALLETSLTVTWKLNHTAWLVPVAGPTL